MDGEIEIRAGDILPERYAARIVPPVMFEHAGHRNTLVVALDGVTSSEREAINAGIMHFAAVMHDDVIFFAFDAGFDIPGVGFTPVVHGDCPFTVHLVPPELRTVPLPENETAMMHLQVMLVNIPGNVVMAIRNALFPGSFTNGMNAMIREQFDKPFDMKIYDRHVNEGYAIYPDYLSIMASASVVAVIECNGKKI